MRGMTFVSLASDRWNDGHDDSSVEDYDTVSTPEPITVTESNFGVSEHTQPLYGSDENDDYVDYSDSHFGVSTDAPIRVRIVYHSSHVLFEAQVLQLVDCTFDAVLVVLG